MTPPHQTSMFHSLSRALGWMFVAALALLPGACNHADENGPKDQTAAPGVKVSLAAPQTLQWPRFIRITGTLLADEETTIAAKVAGRVIAINHDLGDQVTTGQELLRIDPTDYALMLEERRRAFAESLARLGLTELPSGDLAVDSLPSVERARLQQENAQARHERGRKLAERQPPMISEQDFADLRTEWEVSQSNLKVEKLAAEANLAEAKTLDAQVRIAQQKMADCVHVVPGQSGDSTPARQYEVAAKLVSTGDYVQIGAPLFRLVDADPVKLRAMIPERRMTDVRVDQGVEVRVDAFSDAFEGRVARISPAVDPASRTFAAEIDVANPQRRLKPGSFATAMIQIGREDILAVPADSVRTFAGVSKVMIVEDGKAVERRVEAGDQRDGLVEIRSGLSAQDKIILRPPASLVTGAPVEVAAEVAAGARQ